VRKENEWIQIAMMKKADAKPINNKLKDKDH
jgi:hypothetical protein